MKLRNVLIVVNDMDRAINFYKEIFGLQIILNQDGNVIMTEGLVLQDSNIWRKFLDKDLAPKNNMTELYFEEPDIDNQGRYYSADFRAIVPSPGATQVLINYEDFICYGTIIIVGSVSFFSDLTEKDDDNQGRNKI